MNKISEMGAPILTGQFYSGKYARLTLLGEKTGENDGVVRLTEAGRTPLEFTFRGVFCDHFDADIRRDTQYEVTWDGLEVVYAYLSQSDGGAEICYLAFGTDGITAYPPEALTPLYGQEYRCAFHFSPIRGWMNDPNGLCKFRGEYHMFYQFNPADQLWGNIHWGHAVSRDLLHWKHLPIARYPQPELMNTAHLRGGAYSGTAVVENDCMKLFLTRHIGDDGRSWCQEWTVRCESRDGIQFGAETECVRNLPSQLASDFRDPKVFRYNGEWLMLTGTRTEGCPAVAVHSSGNLEDWHYQGLFYVERDEKYLQAECPDLVEVDGKLVFTVGYHNRPGKSNQVRRDVVYYIGHMEGYRFVCESKGLLDYGRDFYAAQTFSGVEPPVLLGWNSDYAMRHIPEKSGANGTMSLPRVLSLRDGKLLSFPTEAVAPLEENRHCFDGQTAFVCPEEGGYHLHLEMPEKTELNLVLASADEEGIRLSLSEDGGSIRLLGKQEPLPELPEVRTLDAYVDRALLEIFVNDGEWVFTRRVYGSHLDHTVHAASSRPFLKAFAARIRPVW